MTRKTTRSPHAALFIGAAFLATPAFAQDAPVAPPPVVSTVPAPAPAPAPTPAAPVTFAPATPTVQAVPAAPEAAPARAPAPRPAARTTTTRQVTRTTAQTTAPAPQPAPATAPAEQPTPTAVTPPVAAEPAAPAQTETATTTTEVAPQQRALWPWLLGGALLVIGVLAALMMRRRNPEAEEVYEEAYEPPLAAEQPGVAERSFAPRHEPEVAPYAAAPLAAAAAFEPVAIEDDASLAKPNAEDLAGVTDASAPVHHRPWLEFGMRPVRAGTSADEGVVEIELTVGNSGDETAKDVRISTFLLPAGSAGEMEGMLINRPNDSSVPPVSIAPGEGTRVDATLAVLRSELEAQGGSFSPVVVADARYTMADGTEGRTSATFRVGLWNDGEGIEPIDIGRPQMHENVAAELHGTPAHA
jgi:hypothetical protein